jgi:hypothetical protein
MSTTTMQEPVAAPRLAATLAPIMGVVFVAFLVIGAAMPVLPLHVHEASPTTAMTHIAIQESVDGKNVDWMEKVSDEQYRR